MIRVFTLLATTDRMLHQWDAKSMVLIGGSLRVFVYPYPNPSFLNWWPPAGAAIPRLALVKLNTNLTIHPHVSNDTAVTSVYMSANCSLLVKTATKRGSSSGHWGFIASHSSSSQTLTNCLLKNFYYECHRPTTNSSDSILPGASLLYIPEKGEHTFLLGLYVGVHPQKKSLVFFALHDPFTDWLLLRMAHQASLLGTKGTITFWVVFIAIFNGLSIAMLCLLSYRI